MRFQDEGEAITYIFRSLRKLHGQERGPDELSRNPQPTIDLLRRRELVDPRVEFAVVTGSKGKGSTTAITARLLQSLGHTVGMMTSPHLVSYRERIRVNGRAIPEEDLLRILSDLAPDIDEIEAGLSPAQYFSPQGLFLAVALRWFAEQNVAAAVLEVGRGGRFDDIAVVPNNLSLFTPIMLEHREYLGPTLERIAWHKAGIIKAASYAYSVPQPSEVLEVLQAEADQLGAEFAWIAPMDMGEYLGEAADGARMRLGRYGEVTLGLHGRYQVDNATLAVQGAGNMHARLNGIPHGSPEYVERIRAGLASVNWPGRLQKLQDSPAVYVDGAINGESARMVTRSLEKSLTDPVIAIIAVPADKDAEGVYRELGLVAETVILTETARNPILHWATPDAALESARRFNSDSRYAPDLSAAVEQAKALAGPRGTILIAGTQSIVADAAALWHLSYEQL